MDRTANTIDILQNVVFPCMAGPYLLSGRAVLEGIDAFLCAKEISEMIEAKILFLENYSHPFFNTHGEGKELVKAWTTIYNLEFEEEVDISIGVADVVVYAADTGIFEIGTTRPTKILLLLKYLIKLSKPYSIHFWPYKIKNAFVFRNWEF